MVDQEKSEDSNEAVVTYGLLSLLYEIRVAAGDKAGKLMQEDLVELIAKMRANTDRVAFLCQRFGVLAAVAMEDDLLERAAAIRQCIDEIESDYD